jgi:trk system potassium uptake protein TrkH
MAWVLQGLLTTLAPIPMLAATLVDAPDTVLGAAGTTSGVAIAITSLSALLLLIGGGVLPDRPGVGRPLSLLGLLVGLGICLPAIAQAPAAALAIFVLVGGIVAVMVSQSAQLIPRWSAQLAPDHPRQKVGAVWASAPVALFAWLVVDDPDLQHFDWGVLISLGCFGVAWAHAGRWLWTSFQRIRGRQRWLGLVPVLLLGLSSGALATGAMEAGLMGLALSLMLVLGLLAITQQSARLLMGDLAAHPAVLLFVTFAALGIGGGALLQVPLSATGAPIPYIDALFTAVSAACVTGLATVDPATAFSGTGHLIVMLLIQVGGLGIMTYSAAATLMLGSRLSLKAAATTASLIGSAGDVALRSALNRVLAYTFICEAVGALILAACFVWHGDTVPEALWRGIFTAVSAFCNAGFALQTDNLIPYQRDPIVIHTISLLIILGGLGAGVVAAVPGLLRREPTSVQVRLVLWTTLLLLVAPTPILAGLEWNHSLSHLPWWDKLSNAVFLSVTPRTAGFNSVYMTELQPATSALTMLLMFIGGSPASTAGGIKTTTAALLALSVFASLQSDTKVRIFNKQIAHQTLYQAAAVATAGAMTVCVAWFALLTTQTIDPFALLFETFSATGTVGLSLGITGQLDSIGKIVIILCMFLGRVGPLTLFMLLSEQRKESGWKHPEETVTVG